MKQATKTLKVLLFEDNDADAFLVREYLSGSGTEDFEINSFGTFREGHEFLLAAPNGDIDVILLDLTLPDAHQLEALEKIHSQWSHIPVLILTGLDSEEMAYKALKKGAQDYISKNQMNRDGLIRAIHYAIERKDAVSAVVKLASRLKRQNEKMSFDLKLAKEMQMALFPDSNAAEQMESDPQGRKWHLSYRYIPCEDLAGDFFKAWPLDNNRMGILICDVMGQGVSAALVAALIRGFVDEDSEFLEKPGLLLSHLNAKMKANLWDRGMEIFASTLYLIADPHEGCITVASGGHLELYRTSPQERRARSLSGENECPALGIRDNVQFIEESYPYSPNDTVILCTDGLCSISNSKQQCFDTQIETVLEDHIESELDPMLDSLISAARSFSNEEQMNDDICLLGLKFG